jgi:hypothetical protein
LFPLFAAGVVDTGGNSPLALMTPVAKMVEKFAAGVVDTFGNLPQASLTLAKMVPPEASKNGGKICRR